MNTVELITEWIQELAQDVRSEIETLSDEALAWQPDPLANNIGVTVWHFSRWLDLLTVQAFQNRPAQEEQWHTRGWAEKTGYDPRGIGYRGFGTVTGYTWAEVQAVPALSAAELLTYLDQVCQALQTHLLAMEPEALHQPVLGLGRQRTVYQWLKPILKGCLGHLGEIQALKAMAGRIA